MGTVITETPFSIEIGGGWEKGLCQDVEFAGSLFEEQDRPQATFPWCKAGGDLTQGGAQRFLTDLRLNAFGQRWPIKSLQMVAQVEGASSVLKGAEGGIQPTR
jgi:hypothetical protein